MHRQPEILRRWAATAVTAGAQSRAGFLRRWAATAGVHRKPPVLRRWAAAAVLAAGALWLSADAAAAHGVGGRLDLPVPAWQLAWAASFAVAASFVALGMFWETPKFRAAADGRILPKPFQQACRVTAAASRTVGVALLGVLLYAGLAGNTNPSVNIAPVAVYIVFWVGLQAVSVLVGDVWLHLSPFSTIADGSARLWARLRSTPAADGDRGAGNQWWAVAAVFGFVWLELAFHDSTETRVLGICLLAYTAAMLTGAATLGRGWLQDAEGFGVLFRMLAAMAPLHRGGGAPGGRANRRADLPHTGEAVGCDAVDWADRERSEGERETPRPDTRDSHPSARALRLRAPLAGLATLTIKPGSAAFILVVLGSTTFDGFTRSSLWLDVAGDRTGWALTIVNTVGLVFVIFAVFVLYRAAIAVMASLTGDSERELADVFAPSLLPIAAAYTVAHYFSYLLLEGRAVERWPRRLAMRSQYPMLAVMICYTVIGLVLLLGA